MRLLNTVHATSELSIRKNSAGALIFQLFSDEDRMSSIRAPLILLLVTTFTYGNAEAVVVSWTDGNGTGLWSDAANWSTGAIPTAADEVAFVGAATANSILDAPFVIGSLDIDDSYGGTLAVGSSLTVINGANVEGAFILMGSQNLTFLQTLFISNQGHFEVPTSAAASNLVLVGGVGVGEEGAFEMRAPGTRMTFGAGSTSFVEAGGSLLIDGGSAGTRAVLRSSSPNDHWFLNLQGGSDSFFNFIDVQDSNAELGGTAMAFSSLDFSNNRNWSFAVGPTPIPEPQTYAMLLAGLGLLGFIATGRARSKKQSPLAERDVSPSCVISWISGRPSAAI